MHVPPNLPRRLHPCSLHAIPQTHPCTPHATARGDEAAHDCAVKITLVRLWLQAGNAGWLREPVLQLPTHSSSDAHHVARDNHAVALLLVVIYTLRFAFVEEGGFDCGEMG